MAGSKEQPSQLSTPALETLNSHDIEDLEMQLASLQGVITNLFSSIAEAKRNSGIGSSARVFSLQRQFSAKKAEFERIQDRLTAIMAASDTEYEGDLQDLMNFGDEQNRVFAPAVLELAVESNGAHTDVKDNNEFTQNPTKNNTADSAATPKQTRRRNTTYANRDSKRGFFLVEVGKLPSSLHEQLLEHAQGPDAETFMNYDDLLRPVIDENRKIYPTDIKYIRDPDLEKLAQSAGYILKIRYSGRGVKKGYRYTREASPAQPTPLPHPSTSRTEATRIPTNGSTSHSEKATTAPRTPQTYTQPVNSDRFPRKNSAETPPTTTSSQSETRKAHSYTRMVQIITAAFRTYETDYRTLTGQQTVPNEVTLASATAIFMRKGLRLNTPDVKASKFGRDQDNRWVLTMPEFIALFNLIQAGAPINDLAGDALLEVKQNIIDEINAKAGVTTE